MKTAKEMYDFVVKNEYGHDTLLRRGLKLFEVIENQLTPYEQVAIAMIGEYKHQGKENRGACAVAITDAKIIIGQRDVLLSGRWSKQVNLRNINDIILNKFFLVGEIVFQTVDDVFSILLDARVVKKVYNTILTYLEQLKFDQNKQQVRETPLPNEDEEIAKKIMLYKKLYDEGFITYEEYQAKKGKLLKI